MKAGLSERKNITPQQAVKILEQRGLKVSEKDAEIILDFLYFLGKLSVNQYVKSVDNNNKSKP
ncbi:MAG TPA: hypothetical protein VL442_10250 [Mucilaginibacter sp.]|jgi:hypothetical protein|nr:hypothetical protein [Mucilaginibacter sp.]